MGGDLEVTGADDPPKFEMGDGPCIRPSKFGEEVLFDAWQSMN